MGNWMPGAIVVATNDDGGSMLGGEKKVTWHTFEVGTSMSALRGAQVLNNAGNSVHLCFNPVSGQVTQMVAANRAGRGLRNALGGVQTNRSGSINIQIEVVGFAKDPWTSTLTTAGRATLGRIMAWLRDLGIPDTWPAGDPPSYPYGRSARLASVWGKSGHFCHAQAPENDHGDCGAISPSILFGVGAIIRPKPIPTIPGENKAMSHLQIAARLYPSNIWDAATERGLMAVRNAAYSKTFPESVQYVQNRIGVKADGQWGPASRQALTIVVKAMQRTLGLISDGDWGPQTDAVFLAARKKNRG